MGEETNSGLGGARTHNQRLKRAQIQIYNVLVIKLFTIMQILVALFVVLPVYPCCSFSRRF